MVVPLDSYRRDESFRRAAARPSRDADVRSDERVVGASDLCGFAADWASPIEALPLILATPARFTSALANIDPEQWSRRERDGGSPLQDLADVAELYHATANGSGSSSNRRATEITPAHDERNFAVSADSPPIVRAGVVRGLSRSGTSCQRGSARRLDTHSQRPRPNGERGDAAARSPRRRTRSSSRRPTSRAHSSAINRHVDRAPACYEPGEHSVPKPIRCCAVLRTHHDASTGGTNLEIGRELAVALITATLNLRYGDGDAELFEQALSDASASAGMDCTVRELAHCAGTLANIAAHGNGVDTLEWWSAIAKQITIEGTDLAEPVITPVMGDVHLGGMQRGRRQNGR